MAQSVRHFATMSTELLRNEPKDNQNEVPTDIGDRTGVFVELSHAPMRESDHSDATTELVFSTGDQPGGMADRTTSFLCRLRIHGLRYLWEPPGFSFGRRFLWMLVFLLALALTLTISSVSFQRLLNHPKQIRTQRHLPKQLLFPAVTICNNNPVRFPQLTKLDLLALGVRLGLLTSSVNPHGRYAYNLTANPLVLQALAAQDQVQRLSWFTHLANFSQFLLPRQMPVPRPELFKRLGHSLDDMLLSCRFRNIKCGPQDFITVYTRYGKCYTFNSGRNGRPLVYTLKGGVGNGLEMMIDIQQDEYLPVWSDTDETSFEAGIKVQIHSQKEPPFIEQLGFGVSPGFQTLVSCQEQQLIYLPPPWGTCKSTLPKTTFFNTYSVTACLIDCETRYLMENCNCRMVHMPGDGPYCTPEQYQDCVDLALNFLFENDSELCVCESPCNMTRYNKELSMVRIPSQASAKYLAKKLNKTETYIAENLLVLNIFFETLNYETIEQTKAYEVASLLGDIGGQMCLFIGASILTILEIFDYIYEVIKDKTVRYFQRRKKQKQAGDNAVPMTEDDETQRTHPQGGSFSSGTMAPHHHHHHLLHQHGTRGNYEDFAC
uniref:Acid-sensing (proton-gated) ion channel 1b n=1 Tax=Eptatretus burgeri TaxID=7764 RepID=A0A8C4N962_EPTBU